jgi:hypothetical protein
MPLSVVRKKLGRPYYEAPDCAIYNTDCLEAMKRILCHFLNTLIGVVIGLLRYTG